ncbi:MAG: Maf family protein [Elusimicrobiota bacterium]|nr:Maf family protein [Elusimicrobiota bacterium]
MKYSEDCHGRQIILASKSPRRSELLKKAGLEFTVAPSAYKEEMHLDLRPEQLAEYLALKKAEDVAASHPEALVIGADTIVVVDGIALGQPADAATAREMLEKLSGRGHRVITAFALMCLASGAKKVKSVSTKVYFRPLTAEEIDSYIKSGEPMDKAGAYAIQGGAASFVEKTEGDYYNVVGLPVGEVMKSLEEIKDGASGTEMI